MRLIDADGFERRLMFSATIYDELNADGLYSVLEELRQTSTIDAEIIKHGRWKEQGSNVIGCSECGSTIICITKKRPNYCPDCGAKMEST